jgi:murein DD-endopeptidase MepM/ murein hydrolase activator NlpD
MHLNKLRWLSVILAFASFSGTIVYLIVSTDEKPSSNTHYLTSLEVGNIPEQEFNFDKLPANRAPSSATSAISQKYFSQLLVEIKQLENSLDRAENKREMLESLTLGHHIENRRYFSGRPIIKRWPPSYYGVRKDPFNGRATIYKGIDFAKKEDDDIISIVSSAIS